MTTPIKSLFDVLPKAYQLPPEPIPKKIPKLEKKDGKFIWGSADRKVKK